MQKRFPDFVCIGAAKAGTTSLYYYLATHPEICMTHKKEINFFSNLEVWRKGYEWYQKQFASPELLCGDVSPQYAMSPVYSEAAARLYETNPAVKIIYLTRDPIERLISEYVDSVAGCVEDRPIDIVLQDISLDNHYVANSCYDYQMQQYKEFFKKDQLFVVSAEDLRQQRDKTLAKIYDFLGVDYYQDERFDQEFNVTQAKRITSKPRKRVRWFYSSQLLARFIRGVLPNKWHQRLFPLPQKGARVVPPQLKESDRQELEKFFVKDQEKLYAWLEKNHKKVDLG